MIFLERINRLSLLVRCLARSLVCGVSNQVPHTISRVLIIPTGKLGDLVCNTPVLQAIRLHLPKAYIIVAGTSKLHQALLVDSGLFDDYLDLSESGAVQKIKKAEVGVAIITGPSFISVAHAYLSGIPLVIAPVVEGGFSPAMTRPYKILQQLVKTFPYRIDSYAPRERLRALEPLGIFTADTTKQLGFSENADRKIKQFFIHNAIVAGEDFVVGISPVAGNKIKEWPTERFARVVDHLVNKYQARVLIIGGTNDKKKVRETIDFLATKMKDKIVEVTNLNLDELKAMISKLSLFISVDTGPIYIAEAFEVPTINIIGPVDENVQPPRGFINRNVLPPGRTRAELSILNARSYDEKEAKRQVMSISVSLVQESIDQLIATLPGNLLT